MKIWITYAWTDNEDGNFDYLVQELKKVGIDAIFDRVALVPGQMLWSQIGDKIMKGDFDGWAYLITQNSITSQPCLEELEYAINRAISGKSENFPLMGLVSGISFERVPPSLKVRLCINLSSHNWKEEVKAGLQRRAPQVASQPQTRFTCKVHKGAGNTTIVEMQPRFEKIINWRFIVPKDAEISSWGHGLADGSGNVTGMNMNTMEMEGEMNGMQVKCFGSGDILSDGIAAKAVFTNGVPEFIAFGLCKEPFGQPENIEFFKLQ